MLTIFCYIALRSPGLAAKTVVLMEDMTAAFFFFSFCFFVLTTVVTITFSTRIADTLAPPTDTLKHFIIHILISEVLISLMKSSAILAPSDLIPSSSLQNKLQKKTHK